MNTTTILVLIIEILVATTTILWYKYRTATAGAFSDNALFLVKRIRQVAFFAVLACFLLMYFVPSVAVFFLSVAIIHVFIVGFILSIMIMMDRKIAQHTQRDLYLSAARKM